MQQQFISKSCSWYHATLNSSQLAELQTISGLKPNYLGNFQQCVSQPTHNYYLVKYTIDSQEGTFLSGICYNYSCNSTDFLYMYNAFNQYDKLPTQVISIEEISRESESINLLQLAAFAIVLVYLLIVTTFTILNIYFGQKNRKTRFYKLCDLFCFRSSFRVFTQKAHNNQRNGLMVGLRAIAFCMMIIYNTGFTLLKAPSLNLTSAGISVQQIIIALAYYGFDIWFFVSGFTIAVELSKNWQKHHSSKFAILLLLRGFIQIWIVCLLTIINIKILLPLFGSGPLWQVFQDYLSKQCSFSISYFLLTSNIFKGQCNYFLWVWDVTLQLSFFAIILFFIKNSIIRFRKAIYRGFHIFLVIGAFLLAAFKYQQLNIRTGLIQGWIYSVPLIKGMSYFCGFNLGLFYFQYRASKQKQKFIVLRIFKYKLIRILSPMSGIAIIIGLISYFIILSPSVSQQAQSIIHLLVTVILNLCLVLLILPPLLGYSSIINTVLKDHLLDYLSKLSFSAYSMSYSAMIFLLYNRTDDINSNSYKLLVFSSSVLISALIIGFIFYISFEIVLYRFVQKYMGGENRKFIQFY